MAKTGWIKQLYTGLACLLAFVLCLHPKWVPPAIIALAVCSLFLFKPRVFVQHKVALVLVSFYLLHVIALLYTANMPEGLFDLELKLSLIVFPLAVFPVSLLGRQQVEKIYAFFVLGCVAALVVCVHKAYWNYQYESFCIEQNLYHQNIRFNYFLSSRFSYFMHPSYFAMYLAFALSILITGKASFLNRIGWRVSLSAVFIAAIALLASKSGVAVLGVLMVYFMLRFKQYRKYIVAGIVAFALVVAGLFYFSTEFAGRFKNAFAVFNSENTDSASAESSEARVLVWESAGSMILKSPVVGYGTGDVKDVLMNSYRESGFTGVLEKQLNAHNQFLQTTLALGMVGLGVFVFIFVLAFRLFRQNNSATGLLLLLIFILNFFVESMLETQAGVVFFAFWLLFEAYQQPAKISPVE